jgi:hypothetical protein
MKTKVKIACSQFLIQNFKRKNNNLQQKMRPGFIRNYKIISKGLQKQAEKYFIRHLSKHHFPLAD